MYFYIQATIHDDADQELDATELPVRFSSRAKAEQFVRAYLRHSFADGASGYDAHRRNWWGCAGDAQLMLERFSIECREGSAAEADSTVELA